MIASWQYRRFHVSYLIAWTTVGVLTGVWAGQYVQNISPWVLIVAIAAGLGAFRSRRWYACVVVLIVGGLCGLMRGSSYAQELGAVTRLQGTSVVLQAVITQDPVQQGDAPIWKVQASALNYHDTALAGEVYATVLSDTPLLRGDKLTLQGKVTDGFGSFQIAMYRAELLKVQHSEDIFLKIRDIFAQSVRRVLPEPEASLGVGFVVGQKSSLPADFEEQLKIVGLTHLVVASGYNLTILVRFARRVLARHSRYLALFGSIVLIVGFVAISGMSPSMQRAAVVTVLSLLAWYYGRKFHPVQLILLVAAGSALLYPVYVWSDIGWLLSFVAFTGVLVVAPLLTRLLYAEHKTPSAFSRLLIETMSAELMTLPVIVVVFGYIPIYALVANILVAPVIPFAMALTGVAGLVGCLGTALQILALPAAIVIAYVVAVVEKFSKLPFSSVEFSGSVMLAVSWFVVLSIGLVVVWQRKRVDLSETSATE